jgi:hypothetical protein
MSAAIRRAVQLTRHPRFIPWCLLVVFTSLYFASGVGVMNSSDGPDYALTQALVEEHTSKLDHFSKWISPDYVTIGNHDYAKRSVGLSLLGVPAYMLARGFGRWAVEPYAGQHAGIDSSSRVEALSLIFPALCGGVTVLLVFLISLHFTGDTRAALIAACATGVGSLLWKYSHSYQRVPLYVCLIVLAFYLLLTFKPGQSSWGRALVIGLVSAYAIVAESTTLFVFPVFAIWFVYLVARGDPATRKSLVAAFVAGLALSLSALFVYDLLTFHELAGNLYQKVPKNSWMTYPALFSTPLFPSVFVNLWNTGTVPLDSISPILRDHPIWFQQEGAYWAVRTTYRGLFVQSPYLIPAVIGTVAFVRRFTVPAAAALAACLIVLISMAKFVDFFSPNSFDTRLFLPMVPFLSIGLAFWWRSVWALPSRGFAFVLSLVTVYLLGVSAYNGWYSEVTDYGPHVTGNHRFDPSQLPSPLLSANHLFDNLGALVFNTFPNAFNLWYIVVFAGAAWFVYLWYQEGRYWLAGKRVHLASPARGMGEANSE